MKMKRSLSGMLLGALLSGSVVLGVSFAGVSPDVDALLDAALQEDPLTVDDWPLYQAALLEHEALEPLLEELDERIEAAPKALAPRWLSAQLHWRYGLLEEARTHFEKAEEVSDQPLIKFRLAQLLDASGKPKEAIEQYLATLEAEPKPGDALAERIRLRLALLKSTGAKAEEVDVDLPKFAEEREQTFQNRAAVVLALAGKPKESLELYQPGDDEKTQFKQWIRMAEWAMAAKDMAKAQEHAWSALGAARLTRDRRYALTVLSEAYRRDKNLAGLIDKFAAEEKLHDDARLAWIDLLREQGDAEKALELFEEAREGKAAFTIDMRRQLLEICREAEREDLLVQNFEEMMRTDPRRLEWRVGLSRYYLERGRREKGIAVWDAYEASAESGAVLAAAEAVVELGLDEVATRFTEKVIREGLAPQKLAALQFQFDLHRQRGQEDPMKAVLERNGRDRRSRRFREGSASRVLGADGPARPGRTGTRGVAGSQGTRGFFVGFGNAPRVALLRDRRGGKGV